MPRPRSACTEQDGLAQARDVQAVTEAPGLGETRDWMRVSATRGTHLDKLLAQIRVRLPEGPELYPADQVTSRMCKR